MDVVLLPLCLLLHVDHCLATRLPDLAKTGDTLLLRKLLWIDHSSSGVLGQITTTLPPGIIACLSVEMRPLRIRDTLLHLAIHFREF